ncbi:hypothetical protein J2Z35_001944 [Acetoanaerobium pronyense]|uniref:DUF3787 domain-containing protein n=1 Tax=Acetoanaerobium pronyense TaxID=1482736 RepID=A0ABS4KK20_9FIRM|nr:DUF3787 domain-containing protein [Acetoanaerobium pronyense]MBP2028143.1 hypothetical protein [Acetoanaerobium pronyense]
MSKDKKISEEQENKINKTKDICDVNEKDKSSIPATDVYDSVKCHTPDTNVDIPTEEAVEKAKKWVEDENIK